MKVLYRNLQLQGLAALHLFWDQASAQTATCDAFFTGWLKLEGTIALAAEPFNLKVCALPDCGIVTRRYSC